MITKQQFKDGVKFKYENTTYKASHHLLFRDDESYYGSNSGGYVGNVLKIGTKSFTIYTFLMGKKVTVKVNYSDCEPVIAE
jgi:hypothetical protein